MDIVRRTYAEINIGAIESNVNKIVNKFDKYKYRFAVVKADAYGRGILEVSKAVIKGGCNYLAVATLEEALIIRREIPEIPILCLGVIHKEYIKECIINNITITANTLEYLEEIIEYDTKDLKVHLKLNTGMNRLRNFKC